MESPRNDTLSAFPGPHAPSGPARTPTDGRSAHDALTLKLHGGPEAAAAARHAVSGLGEDLEPPVMETLRLLVTELVSNSVRHAKARTVAVRALVTNPAVWVEVTDGGPGFEAKPAKKRDAAGGWGLFLVDRLADRWGVDRERRSTRVWFELRRT